jgi:hypothetical protein
MTHRLLLAAFSSSLAALGSACGPECSSLSDCPADSVCSAEGTCVAHVAGPVAGRADIPRRNGPAVDGQFELPTGLTAEEATVTGAIGPVAGFDGDASPSAGLFGAMLQIWLNTESPAGTGIVIVSLDVGNLDELADGAYDVGRSDGVAPSDASFVQLCSNTADGTRHFDGVAPDATVTVTTHDDESREVTVDATITRGFDESMSNDQPTRTHSRLVLR